MAYTKRIATAYPVSRHIWHMAMAAPVSLGDNTDMLYLMQYSNQWTAVCMAKIGSLKFLMVCVSRLRDPSEAYSQVFMKYARFVSLSQETLIGWCAKQTDDQGMLVEHFIMANILLVVNKQSQPYTFSTPNGQNNIDLRLRVAFTRITRGEVLK